MPDFYTLVILLNNQPEEIGEKQLSVLGSRGGLISPSVFKWPWSQSCQNLVKIKKSSEPKGQ